MDEDALTMDLTRHLPEAVPPRRRLLRIAGSGRTAAGSGRIALGPSPAAIGSHPAQVKSALINSGAGAPKRRMFRLRRRLTGAAALLAVGATMVVAAPGASALPLQIAMSPTYSSQVMHLLNLERKANHLPILITNNRLVSTAYYHNRVMAGHNVMTHQYPGEAALGTRLSQAKVSWSYAGENVAWNSAISSAGAQYLEKVMYGEHAPNNGHRRNILDRSYTQAGVSVLVDRTHKKIWLTVDFARPRR
jgi:uncharacterized protein YkwD